MTKLIAVIAGLALATLGLASAQLASSAEPVRTATVGTTDDDGAATTTDDDGAATTADDHGAETATAPVAAGREPGEDLRGPCDEGEHADDPRCGGAATAEDDDDR